LVFVFTFALTAIDFAAVFGEHFGGGVSVVDKFLDVQSFVHLGGDGLPLFR
jgi:hypothetical protein